MQTSPVPLSAPTPIMLDLTPEEKAEQVLIHINSRVESSASRAKEGRGAKNPKWGKGPSLQEQALFLQGYNREEYNRLYVH